MADFFNATFKFNTEPTAEEFNELLYGILPAGIYKGGSVSPGPGLSVRIEPFVARSDYLTVRTYEEHTVQVPKNKKSYLCLEAIFYPTAPTNARWIVLTEEEYASYPEKNSLIIFAYLNVPNVVIIDVAYIDMSIAPRMSFEVESYLNKTIYGTSSFGGPNGTKINHHLGHTKYTVMITASYAPTGGGIGDYWVEKFNNYFLVKNTGASDTSFDWLLYNTNNLTKINPVVTNISKVTLKGIGDSLIFPHNLQTLNHHTYIVPETEDPTLAGYSWIIKGTSQDTISNTGSVVGAIICTYPTNNTTIYGTCTLSGSGRTEITHTLNTMDYVPTISFTSNPDDITSYWFEKKSNSLVIYHTGTATPTVQYCIFKNINQFMSGYLMLNNTSGIVEHNLNDLNHTLFVSPTSDSGKFSIIRGSITDRVYFENSNASFLWLALPQRYWN